jgi:phage shock protein C
MARKTKFYLDKRNARFMGVCSGIADYFGVDPLWIRVATVLGVFATGWLILAYFVIGFLAQPKPAEIYDLLDSDPEERRFWQRARLSPKRSMREVRSNFRDIDRRLASIEAQYTSGSRRLAREIDALKHQ